jgi:hypothetical protein
MKEGEPIGIGGELASVKLGYSPPRLVGDELDAHQECYRKAE